MLYSSGFMSRTYSVEDKMNLTTVLHHAPPHDDTNPHQACHHHRPPHPPPRTTPRDCPTHSPDDGFRVAGLEISKGQLVGGFVPMVIVVLVVWVVGIEEGAWGRQTRRLILRHHRWRPMVDIGVRFPSGADSIVRGYMRLCTGKASD